jgi:hypothetical protein
MADMSAKEKAQELVDKFISVPLLDSYEAKQCALVAIDEMLDFRNALYINEGSLAHKYLLDIKQEIKKL